MTTLYALKDPDGKIVSTLHASRVSADCDLRWTGAHIYGGPATADAYRRVARRLGWRIVKVRVVEVDRV